MDGAAGFATHKYRTNHAVRRKPTPYLGQSEFPGPPFGHE
jgi:hypothetical protein